jgi:anaerobic magnesium-protoporphyrin IX monomethyl ester cyclase
VILDQNIDPFPVSELIERIRNEDPLFLGIYTATHLKQAVLSSIQFLRANNIKTPIILGGPGCYSAKDYLTAGADFVCHGEGEITISELADYLTIKAVSLQSIKGISYLENGRFVENAARPRIEDLDRLPFPDWDSVDIRQYSDSRIFNMKKPYATIMASRGCFGHCAFCSSPNFWGNVRVRSPENVIAEMEYLVDTHRVQYIGFKDDVFCFEAQWSEEFCRLYKKKKFSLSWSCSSYPLVFAKDTKKRLGQLRDIHCDLMILGLQKTDPGMLKSIGRNPLEIEAVERIVKEAKKIGISTVVEFIFGLPGETNQTITADLKYGLKIKPNYIQCYDLLSLEGSALYDEYFSKQKKPTELLEAYLKTRILKGMIAFYLNPIVIFQNIKGLFRNPKFFIVGIQYVYKLIVFRFSIKRR